MAASHWPRATIRADNRFPVSRCRSSREVGPSGHGRPYRGTVGTPLGSERRQPGHHAYALRSGSHHAGPSGQAGKARHRWVSPALEKPTGLSTDTAAMRPKATHAGEATTLLDDHGALRPRVELAEVLVGAGGVERDGIALALRECS